MILEENTLIEENEGLLADSKDEKREAERGRKMARKIEDSSTLDIVIVSMK